MKQPQVLTMCLFMLLALCTTHGWGQTPPPKPNLNGRTPIEGTLPIDANIYILILAGIVIGVYALLKYRPLSGKPE